MLCKILKNPFLLRLEGPVSFPCRDHPCHIPEVRTPQRPVNKRAQALCHHLRNASAEFEENTLSWQLYTGKPRVVGAATAVTELRFPALGLAYLTQPPFQLLYGIFLSQLQSFLVLECCLMHLNCSLSCPRPNRHPSPIAILEFSSGQNWMVLTGHLQHSSSLTETIRNPKTAQV